MGFCLDWKQATSKPHRIESNRITATCGVPISHTCARLLDQGRSSGAASCYKKTMTRTVTATDGSVILRASPSFACHKRAFEQPPPLKMTLTGDYFVGAEKTTMVGDSGHLDFTFNSATHPFRSR
jgi:hypothetical protein